MSESAVTSTGPSLEQILWRAVDRYSEDPSLVDAEEFAAHIADAFDGDIPVEAWVEKFFEGPEALKKAAPKDMAEAITKASKSRLAVYEFDLNRLEYVVIEDGDKMVVVSDFGQFALENNDIVSRAIAGATLPEKPDRKGSEPRAFFVKGSGEVVAIDVKKIARTLEQLAVRQVSSPAVDKPGSRMLPFGPVRKTASEAREARILRQDPRAAAQPPKLLGMFQQRLAAAAAKQQPTPPGNAATAVFVIMPDGTLARPAIGSATRWQDMVSEWTSRASALGPAGAQQVIHVTNTQKFIVQSGTVVAMFSGGSSAGAGAMAQSRADGIVAARANGAPVRVLGDDELAKAISGGGQLVGGFAAKDRFWIQPEASFRPTESQQAKLAGVDDAAVVGTPLQLGQITGDPWADWALMGGGKVMMAALDRGDEISAPPALAQSLRGMKGREMLLDGSSVVAFRGPDGSVLVQRANGAIRLAATDRPDAGEINLEVQPKRISDIAPRSGAIPATALGALQVALERTAMAGGYRLPIVKLESADDALDVGNMLALDAGDDRRTQIKLAGPVGFYDGFSGPTAQLVLSMPFPSSGELNVGQDLEEALQAYMGGFVSPSNSFAGGGMPRGVEALGMAAGGGGLMLRFRGAGAQMAGGDLGDLDLPAMHAQAMRGAREAVLTFNLGDVQPALAGQPSLSGLPALLAKALEQGGEWEAGPGAPMPIALRQIALSAPFDMVPELVEGAQPIAALEPRRLNPGEDEVVIPMPLWAQMGRGALSETDQIMASPRGPRGYAPPLGVYQLVAPPGMPYDLTGGAPVGTPGIVEVNGPIGLQLVAPGVRGGQSVVAQAGVGNRTVLGRIAVDDSESIVGRRGRVRIGAPLDPDAAQRARDTNALSAGSDSTSGSNILSQGGDGSASTDTLVSGGQMPGLDMPSSGNYVDGTFAAPQRPMTGALSSALRMSDDVNSRALPGRPTMASDGTFSQSASGGSSSDFLSRAQAAGRSQAAGSETFGSASSGWSSDASQQIVVGSPDGSSAQTFGSAGSSGDSMQASAAADGVRSQVDSSTNSLSQSSDFDGAGYVAGVSPGAWSGHSRHAPGYQTWNYAAGRNDSNFSSGGVNLSGLSRPSYPSLPSSLRFRYVGAPLWWSGTTRSIGSAGADSEETEDISTRTLKSGLRAANSAASLWRSIFVSGGVSTASPDDDATGGMDTQRDGAADEMGALGSKLDALAAASMVTGAGPARAGGPGAETVYVAMNGQGNAGAVTGSAAQRAKANALELSIVAAIPPAPPPLESMSATGGDAPHARAKGHPQHGGHHKEGSDAVSHSKIEGSVDAIAQRIYHRIRRRIQNDRERFGG